MTQPTKVLLFGMDPQAAGAASAAPSHESNPGSLYLIKSTKHKAFATIMALILMALVATALSAMAIAMHMDHMRTQSAHTQAALRQLLLAGAADAVEKSHHWPTTFKASDWSLNLPREMQAATTHLSSHLEPAGDAEASVQITAMIEGHGARQRIQFHRDKESWVVLDAHRGDVY